MELDELKRFIGQANRDDASVHERQMQALKMLASALKRHPDQRWIYGQMAGLYSHMGRDRDALLCSQKMYSLVDFKKIEPHRLTRRGKGIREHVEDHVLKVAGNCTYAVVGTPAKAHLPKRELYDAQRLTRHPLPGGVTDVPCEAPTSLRVGTKQGGRVGSESAPNAPYIWAVPLRLNWKSLRRAARDGLVYDFDCGHVLVTQAGDIIDDRAAQLYRIVFHGFVGAFEVQRRSGGFQCIYPRRYGRIMLRRLVGLLKADEHDVRETGNQVKREIWVKGRRVTIEDYENRYVFRLSDDEFFSVLGLNRHLIKAFCACQTPGVVVAFDKPVAVEPCADPDNPDEALAHPRIRDLVINAFERIRDRVGSGKSVALEREFAFSYDRSTPVPQPRILRGIDLAHNRFERATSGGDSGKLNFRASCPEIRDYVEGQYRMLLDSIDRVPVSGVFNGRPFAGRLMKPSTMTMYAHSFQLDAVRNVIPLTFFDIELAKDLLLVSIRYGTDAIGSYSNNIYSGQPAEDAQCSPIVWYVYDQSRDREWLKNIGEVLLRQDAYWDRYRYIREFGLYTGRFGAPDYDWPAVGEQRNVFSVALNSSLYSHKLLMARIAQTLGWKKNPYIDQAQRLRARINGLFWDDAAGFYFHYDANRGRCFETPAPDFFLKETHHYSLHNLLPLYFGVPDADRAQRMMAKVTSQQYYGRFRGITAVLSGSGGDDRRLRVWPLYNWYILQGLRMYGLNREADRLSADVFNMMFRAWYVYDDFPECYDAVHGYLPEEFPNVGGMGTINMALPFIVDRIGVYYSNLPGQAGMHIRPVRNSGLGNVSFACRISGRWTKIAFRDGRGRK